MTFDDIAAGAAVFLDANTFIYHFSNHPKYGPASTALVERIERQEIRGFTSSHCIADVAHRQQAIAQIGQLGIQVVAVTDQLVSAATSFSRQYELLTGDALIVAVMRQLGLTDIASQDDDFDREPGSLATPLFET
jgi:predicted nucleic acid-binding protein